MRERIDFLEKSPTDAAVVEHALLGSRLHLSRGGAGFRATQRRAPPDTHDACVTGTLVLLDAAASGDWCSRPRAAVTANCRLLRRISLLEYLQLVWPANDRP
jgi:hypothetical protein